MGDPRGASIGASFAHRMHPCEGRSQGRSSFSRDALERIARTSGYAATSIQSKPKPSKKIESFAKAMGSAAPLLQTPENRT